jgi:hypothetical protein
MKKSTKELLYKSVYREIFYYADTKLLELTFLEGTTDYTDDEFKKEELIFSAFFVYKKVHIFCVNTIKLDYIIIPEIQEWLEKTVNPIFVKSEMRKFAVIVSQNVFSKVSIQHTIHKLTKNNPPFKTDYFEDREAALKWLLE